MSRALTPSLYLHSLCLHGLQASLDPRRVLKAQMIFVLGETQEGLRLTSRIPQPGIHREGTYTQNSLHGSSLGYSGFMFHWKSLLPCLFFSLPSFL